VLNSRGWEYDGTTNLYTPKPSGNLESCNQFINYQFFSVAAENVQPRPSQEKLAKLTELVSFLEN